MKKVLLIDVGYYEYFKCYATALTKYCDVTIITKSGVELIDIPADQKKWFYKISEKMPDSRIRSVIRGVEYILVYILICIFTCFTHYDIIHIHWAMIPKIDCMFFKILKKHTHKLIYTAHDFVPHYDVEKKIQTLNSLYQVPNIIIVHGQKCFDEAKKYYPNVQGKLYVQDFGPDSLIENIVLSEACLKKHHKLRKFRTDNKLIISFIGQISEYKGIDIFLDYIREHPINNKIRYLIAGKIIQEFDGITDELNSLADREDVYEYIQYFDDEEENLFYSYSDLIVIPYRTATMSGVFFTAAKYKKALLTTTEGCLKEYIDKIPKHTVNGNEIGVFTCTPDLKSLTDNLDYIVNNFSKEALYEIGENYSNHIYNSYSWDSIIKGVIRDCYEI